MNSTGQSPDAEIAAQSQKPQAPVSVIIPTYNAGEFLTETFASIEQQTHLPLEVIVVDDESTDDTVDNIKQLVAAAPFPVKLLRTGENSGSPGRPMNMGVEAAEGLLIAILDQDDVWLPDKLAMQSEVLSNDETVSLVCSLFDYLRPAGCDGVQPNATISRLTPVMRSEKESWHCDGDAAFDLFVKWENFIGGFPGFMFRRSDWQAKPRFDESFPVAIDFDFLFWLTTRGDMALLPEVHYLRREHDNNVTYREAPRLLDVIRILLRYIPSAKFTQREEYRRALGWKVLRLSQFLAYSGHRQQGAQMLRLYFQVRNSWSGWLLAPGGYGHLHFMNWLKRPLQFTQLRKVNRQEATEAVATVQQLLEDNGIAPRR